MFAVNLDSVFHLFQFAVRHMIDRAERGDAFGRLIATSSNASIFGTARNEHMRPPRPPSTRSYVRSRSSSRATASLRTPFYRGGSAAK